MSKKWIRWQRSAWLLLCCVLLASCSAIGRQEPKLFDGQFSASGKYYTYIYMSVFVFSYQRSGGRSSSSGIATYYLQIIDTQTGQKLLNKPIKLNGFDCRFPHISAVSDDFVVLTCIQDNDGKPQAPMVFSIAEQAITLDGKALRERNPSVPLAGAGNTDLRRSRDQPGAFFVEAKDGRVYRLDPQSGATQVVEGRFEGVEPALIVENWSGLPRGVGEVGDTRKRLEWRGRGVRSQTDFLAPSYLVPHERSETDADALAAFRRDGLLVLSRTEKDSGQHKLLLRLDVDTLATRWSTPLPQRRGDWGNSFDNEQVVRVGNRLLLANSSQLLEIDLETGEITRNVNLVD